VAEQNKRQALFEIKREWMFFSSADQCVEKCHHISLDIAKSLKASKMNHRLLFSVVNSLTLLMLSQPSICHCFICFNQLNEMFRTIICEFIRLYFFNDRSTFHYLITCNLYKGVFLQTVIFSL
jgi:hypothetical protein